MQEKRHLYGLIAGNSLPPGLPCPDSWTWCYKLEVDLCERLRWDLAVQPDELIALTSQLMGVSTNDEDASALLLDSPV